MKRTIRRQMTRFIIPALVALLVSGPAWAADDDAVFLHCSGKYIEGTVEPSTKNIMIARDGSWIDFYDKISRTKTTASRWMYDEGAVEGKLIRMFISFDFENLGIIATYNTKGSPSGLFTGSCIPIKNPLKF